MKIHANYAILSIAREIEYPSGSWVEVTRDYPEIPGAVIRFQDVNSIRPGDHIACGTACSEWRGTVIDIAAAKLSDPFPEFTPADGEEVRYIWIVADERGKNKWNTGHWAPGTDDYHMHPVIGECAVNAWPGGDVSVVRVVGCRIGFEHGFYVGHSGVAESYEGYMALRRRQGVIAQGETR